MAKLAFSLAFLLFAFSYASAGSDIETDSTGVILPVETETTTFLVPVEDSATELPQMRPMQFRPVDRHFKRFPMAFRHGRDIPYGDDMILSSEDRPDEPPRWSEFRVEEKDEWEPRHHHRRHHPFHHDYEHGHDHDEHEHGYHGHRHGYGHEHGHGHGDGFMRSFRKFLGHF